MDDELFKQTYNASIKMLSDLTEKLKELDELREEINAEMVRIRNTALAVSQLIGEEPEIQHPDLFPELIPNDVGLTDAVRRVLQSVDASVSPKLVRTHLERTGYDISRYGNILASIHTILKRLVESGEVEPDTSGSGTSYKWKRYKPGNAGDPKPIEEVPTYNPFMRQKKKPFVKTLEELAKGDKEKK